jgi:hypothetical protein
VKAQEAQHQALLRSRAAQKLAEAEQSRELAKPRDHGLSR